MFLVASKNDSFWHERQLGKADGYGRDYVWGRHNKHAVEMSNRDAARLQESADAAEFTFESLSEDADEAEPAEEAE